MTDEPQPPTPLPDAPALDRAAEEVRAASSEVARTFRAWKDALDARDAVVRVHRPAIVEVGHRAFARRVGRDDAGRDLISEGTVRALIGPISRTTDGDS